MAAFSGWEVVIANVGDSCAYMDTGVEVVLVSLLYPPTPSIIFVGFLASGATPQEFDR